MRLTVKSSISVRHSAGERKKDLRVGSFREVLGEPRDGRSPFSGVSPGITRKERKKEMEIKHSAVFI